MNFYDKLKNYENISSMNYWSQRINAELQYLANISAAEDGIYNALIESALDYLLEQNGLTAAITKENALKAEEMLMSLSEKAKSLTVLCISHAHIDMNWMWGMNETVAVTVDTFRTILNLMKEYKDFTYGQSQASVYKIIEKYAPEMIDEIKAYIHEGRWEITASQWVETDKNMPNGESLARHLLYTKRYLSKLFDIDPDSLKLDFEPDTFGHNANVPEILQNAGVDYYYHCRGYDGHKIYRWQSPSGKEILVFCDPTWYNSDINQASFKQIPLFCKQYGIDKYLKVYGVGDHGGGPTRRDIEFIIDVSKYPLYPTVKFGTYKEFFAGIEQFRSGFPVVKQELNFVFTGCYTSQARIKLANRISEERLNDSEFLSAAAMLKTNMPAKQESFEKAWQNVLFNHFHDILPGSGIMETRYFAHALMQETLSYANTNANIAMRTFADNIDISTIEFDNNNNTISEGGGVGFTMAAVDGNSFPVTERGRGKLRVIHLFNSTMYDRSEPTEFVLWDYHYDLGRMFITDSKGNEVPFQFTGHGSHYWGHTFVKILVDAKVPAFGHSTYIIDLKQYDQGNMFQGAVDPRQDYIGDNDIVLENEYIKAVFCPVTMALVSLVDKESGTALIDKPSCLFRFIKENPRHGMTSWRVGPYMNVSELNSGDYTVHVSDYSHQPLKKYVKFQISFASSSIDVTINLFNGKRMLEFETDVDWREIGGGFIPQLNFFVPVSYQTDKYRYDIPFGTIDRSAIVHDVPANSYMEIINSENRSVYIVTDSKYGFRGNDNSGAVTLLRSSTEPDPYPEFGKHHIKIGVGIGTACEIVPAVDMFRHPVSYASNSGTCGGNVALDGQLIKPDGNVIISTVKTAEDGGLVLRAYNDTDTAKKSSVGINFAFSEVYIADITEMKKIGNCEIDGNTVSFEIPAYSVRTVMIK
ncbi:MAG: glycosyl hydrolase-related protein [Oscillospiraceae bacterium]|nr:glycosyl hydrolase-related protein [Oscillospiraceae bacterium]